MNITFLIGNGFDINRELNTSYKDFYLYCNENNILEDNTIYNEIQKDVNLWSDFEIQVGMETEKIKDEDEANKFMDDFEDFHNTFIDYLEEVSEEYKPTSDQVKSSFKITMKNFHKGIDEVNEKIIETKISRESNQGIIVNFLNFNYTNTLKKYLSLLDSDESILYRNKYISTTCKDPIYLHNDIHNSALLGVNDITQIANTKYFSEDDINFLVKPNSTEINNSNTFKNSEDVINSSNIIVIYGMSIGSTDKKWWQLIGEWLKNNNSYLIIHYYNSSVENPRKSLRRLQRIRNTAKSQFIDNLELSEEEIIEIRKRIFISINSKQVFNNILIKNGVKT